MKNIKFSLWVLMLFLSFAMLCSCGNKTENLFEENNKSEVMSDTLYVKKVENIPNDFIFGMDASCVPSLEKSGVTIYDFLN